MEREIPVFVFARITEKLLEMGDDIEKPF